MTTPKNHSSFALEDLKPGKIALCIHNFTHFSTTRVATLRDLMSQQQLERNCRLRSESHRQRDIVCKGLLREYLSNFIQCPPAQLKFSSNENGKPLLDSPKSALQFNYSHSGDYVVLAFSQESPVGVDMEHCKRRNNLLGIAQHFFSPEEAQALEAQPPWVQSPLFFRYWTLKEAYLKARGEGIFLGLDKFSFRFDPEDDSKAQIIFCEDDFDQSARWQFHSLTPMPDYRVSIALADAKATLDIELYQ